MLGAGCLARCIEKRKTADFFGARAYTQEHVAPSLDSFVRGARLALREVEDIGLFIVVVGKHS